MDTKLALGAGVLSDNFRNTVAGYIDREAQIAQDASGGSNSERQHATALRELADYVRTLGQDEQVPRVIESVRLNGPAPTTDRMSAWAPQNTQQRFVANYGRGPHAPQDKKKALEELAAAAVDDLIKTQGASGQELKAAIVRLQADSDELAAARERTTRDEGTIDGLRERLGAAEVKIGELKERRCRRNSARRASDGLSMPTVLPLATAARSGPR